MELLERRFRRGRCLTDADDHRGDLLNNCKTWSCWAVLNNSTLNQDFESIQEHLIEELTNNPNLTGSAVQVSLRLVGLNPSRIRPFVLLHCRDYRHSQDAYRIIKAFQPWRSFCATHPKFSLMAVETVPSPLGTTIPQRDVYSQAGVPLSLGTPLRVRNEELSDNAAATTTVATVGPYLNVNGRYCFLTVSHPFRPGQQPIPETTDHEATPFRHVYIEDDDDGFDDAGSEASEDEEFSLLSGTRSSAVIISRRDDHSFGPTVDDTSLGSPRSSNEYEPEVNDHLSEIDLLHASATLPQLSRCWDNNSQYMLNHPPSRISSPARSACGDNTLLPVEVTGHVIHTCFDREGYEHDWSLIEETGLYSAGNGVGNTFREPRNAADNLHIKGLAEPPQREIQVSIVSQGHQYTTAMLSPKFSYYKLPGSTTFLRVMEVRRISRPLQRGDSGSAVVDIATGEYHGHIIAGYREYGTALMVPWCDIRDNICDQLGLERHQIGLVRSNNHEENQHECATPREGLGRTRCRVFEILPKSDVLICRLETIEIGGTSNRSDQSGGQCKRRRTQEADRIEAEVEFTALSYCWGSLISEASPKIVVLERSSGRITRREISIPQTLQEALCRLRDMLKVKDQTICSRLWCDAICIDRANPEDKAYQVRNTSTIFRAATSVVSWLGESDVESSQAISFLKSFRATTKTQACDIPTTLSSLHSIFALCGRQYWSRLWIVQEMALAHNAVILCGKDMVLWSKFLEFASYLGEKLLEDITCLRDQMPSAVLDNVARHIKFSFGMRMARALKLIERRRHCSHDTEELAELMTDLCEFHCNDARDAIYAALSLSTDVQHHSDGLKRSIWRNQNGNKSVRRTYRTDLGLIREKGNLAEFLRIDYHLSPMELFCQFVQVQVSKGHLDIICLPSPADFRGLNMPAPSWLPNNGRAPFVQMLDRGEVCRINGDSFASIYLNKGFRACGQTIAKATRDGKTLHVQGWRLGRVVQIFDTALNGTMPRGWFQSAGHRIPESTYQNRLWKVVMAHAQPDHSSDVDLVRKDAFYRAVSECPAANIDVLNLAASKDTRVREYWHKVFATIFNRRLFLTDAGQVGLGPQELETNDTICILHGCSVPVVLRQRSNSNECSLIGECFIYGMMSGEAWESAKAGRLHTEEFVLI